MIEEWKIVESYPDYRVSNTGRIQSRRKGGTQVRIVPWYDLKTHSLKGYKQVHFRYGGIIKSCALHRVIAEAFIPNPGNKPVVNHINWDKLDNKTSNLNWMTTKENVNHLKKPKSQKGIKNANAKLAEKDVLAIRKLSTEGVSNVNIAKLYGMRDSTICEIKKGKLWPHVT